jgi:hypothetical protein
MSDTEITTNEVVELDRTRLAAKRTLMAWGSNRPFHDPLRVCHLQGSGSASEAKHGARSAAARTAQRGACLDRHWPFAMIVACVQHWQYVKKLRPEPPHKPWDLTFIVACLIAMLGLLMFGSTRLGAGPFG